MKNKTCHRCKKAKKLVYVKILKADKTPRPVCIECLKILSESPYETPYKETPQP